ncbi:MAG: GspE/PulE/PilB domain-containing protein [Thermoanaerobaculia bacterium]
MPRGLGEILAESGDLTFRRLRRASEWRRVHGGTIDRALLETGAVREETLLDALCRLTGLPSISRERLAAASREAVEALPADARRRLRALPFDRRGEVLHVAVVDPGNPVLETGLVASTGCDVRLYVTAEPILEDLLAEWEVAVAGAPDGPDLPRRPAEQVVAPAAGEKPPAAPAAAATTTRSAETDPFGRLARALLVDALDEGAEAVEISADGRGAVVRSFAGGAVLSSRPIPAPVLGPLFAWLVERSRPAGPLDEGGLLLERAHRRVRAQVTSTGDGTAWLVLKAEAAPRPAPAENEICLHEAADGDVFCLVCGAPV